MGAFNNLTESEDSTTEKHSNKEEAINGSTMPINKTFKSPLLRATRIGYSAD